MEALLLNTLRPFNTNVINIHLDMVSKFNPVFAYVGQSDHMKKSLYDSLKNDTNGIKLYNQIFDSVVSELN